MKTNNSKKKHRLINFRKSTKPIALSISTLFILSILLVFSPNLVQAASSSGQVGVSSVTASSYSGSNTPNQAIDGDDSTWDYWGTNLMTTAGKLPQWLQLDFGAQASISQITTHFYDGDYRTYTYYIQSSSDGSNWNTIVPTKTGSSTVTDSFAQTSARYVKITVTGNTANLAAHIIEIKVYGSASQQSTSTPAPTSTPTQTQTYASSSGQVGVSSVTASSYSGSNTPNQAIDGDDSTWDYWGTNAMTTAGKLPQWLQLDFGAQASISQITTHFYDGDYRTYTYYIQSSSDGSNWNTIVPTKTGSSTVTDSFAQTSARYVKITVTGNTANLAAHIIEIKVYGSASQQSTSTPAPTSTPTQTQTYASSSGQVGVSSVTASSYSGSNTPNQAIDGDDSTWDYWGTNAMTTAGKLPQWLQLDFGAQASISQITTHFYDGDYRTYTYYIQSSSDGSNWNTIVPTKTGSSTVTDSFAQTSARYVKITVTGNTANLAAHIIEIKVYGSASQQSTSTPAPTSTPTPTPTPMQSYSYSPNLEPLSAFYADMNGAASSYASLDYGTLHNGNPSIRTGPDYVRGTREVDGAWIGVKPGDHIVMSAWIKTAPYATTALFSGAEIGCDFYISSSQGAGIATIDSAGHQAGHPNEAEIANDYSSSTGGITYVNWGKDWTLITWDFYVPTTYYNYVTRSSILSCNPVQIDCMVMWFGGRNTQANAFCWFADTALYINP